MTVGEIRDAIDELMQETAKFSGMDKVEIIRHLEFVTNMLLEEVVQDHVANE